MYQYLSIPTDFQDRAIAFQSLATFYIKYIQIFRSLERCYDQIVHPQKRRLLRTLLDSVIGRFLEIKKEMVKLELSEYHYFDDTLVDLKLTPSDVEIPIPKYFVNENFRALRDREQFLDHLISSTKTDETKVSRYLTICLISRLYGTVTKVC